MRLEVRDGDLVLTQVLYDGPEKAFWEYRTLSGPFYRGNVQSGVVVHVSDRTEYPTAEAFAATLATATVEDATTDGVRSIRYACAGQDARFAYRRYDPAATETRRPDEMQITERWANGAAFEPSPLQSPIAAAQRAGSDDPIHALRPAYLTFADTQTEAVGDVWMYRSADGSTTATCPLITRLTILYPFNGQLNLGGTKPHRAFRVVVSGDSSSIAVEHVDIPTIMFLRNWPAQPEVTLNGESIPAAAVPSGYIARLNPLT